MTEKEQIRQAQQLLHLRENLVHHIECIQFNSKLLRARYLALVKEGFTDEQALFICK